MINTTILFITSIISVLSVFSVANVYATEGISVTVTGNEVNNNWYTCIVEELKKENVIDDNIDNYGYWLQRGEMARIIRNIGILTPGYYTINPFEDLRQGYQGTQYYNDILQLFRNGIYSGVEKDGLLYAKPDEILTREQAASFVVRAFGLETQKNKKISFLDSNEISPYAIESINICSSLGIIEGFPDGYFRPKAQITKAEFLAMVYKVINLSNEFLNPPKDVKSTFHDKYASQNVICTTESSGYNIYDDININCSNISENYYTFGNEFQMEIKKNSQWFPVRVDRGDIDDVGFILEAKTEKNIQIKLERYFDYLQQGEYRIVYLLNRCSYENGKVEVIEYDKEFMWVEFSID